MQRLLFTGNCAQRNVLAKYMKLISLTTKQYDDLCKLINSFIVNAILNKKNEKLTVPLLAILGNLDPVAKKYTLLSIKEYLQSRDLNFPGKYIKRSYFWGQVTSMRESELLNPFYQDIDQAIEQASPDHINLSKYTILAPQASFVEILGDTIDFTCDYIIRNPDKAFVLFLYCQSVTLP
jgi:hypothetical protein